MRPIRAVTFDVGGTWIHPWPSVGAVYANVAQKFGVNIPEPDRLTRGFFEAWALRRDFDYSRTGWRRLVQEAFAALRHPPPSDECFAAIYSRFAEPDCWKVFEDVRSTLKELARMGCKLGLISNWDERLRPLLCRLDLLAGMDVVAISHEVGAIKPARGIFVHAAERLHLAPGDILHVGDSRREDVEGARAAGFQAVLLERGAAPIGDQIASLTAIPSMVSRSNLQPDEGRSRAD